MQLKKGMKQIICEGLELQAAEMPSRERRRRKRQLGRALTKLARLKPPEETVARRLVKRINLHQESLLRFVDDPRIEFHNNRTERQLRPAVIFRKTSFGNRTPEGAKRHSILSTVIQTCRLQGKNVSDFLHNLLESPLDHGPPLTRQLLDTS